MIQEGRMFIKNKYIFSLLTNFILVTLGVLSSVLINRFLGPTLKGEYAYVLNIINLLVLILNLGIYQSYPYNKRQAELSDLKNRYFSIAIIQFIFYLIISIGLIFVFENTIYLILITLVPLMILSKQLLFITMIENINLRNALNIGNQVLYTIVLAIIYAISQPNLISVFSLLYLKEILIILIIIYKFKLRFNIAHFDIKFIVGTVKFGFFPMLTSLLITFNYKFDIILLEFFVDYKYIGLYTVGVGLADKMWVIPDAFKNVLFSKTAKKDSIRDIVLSIKLNLYICFIIVFLIIFCGRDIISILYGHEFVDAYSVSVIIFIGIIPMIFFKLLNTLFISNGMQKTSFLILLASVLFNVSGNLILIPELGIEGAAYSSVVSYSICGLLFASIFCVKWKVSFKELLVFHLGEIRLIKASLKQKGKKNELFKSN